MKRQADKFVVHCKRDKFDVYIGRPSIWGNIFSHLPGKGDIEVDSREDAVAMYELYIRGNKELRAQLYNLKGKVLGCWCSPHECHGEVLRKLLKEMEDDESNKDAGKGS